jgi:hypothetical protein
MPDTAKGSGKPDRGKSSAAAAAATSPDKKTLKQFTANAKSLIDKFGAGEKITLPIMNKQDSVEEFVELISKMKGTKADQLREMLTANKMKKHIRNKADMIAALLMHNIGDKTESDAE